MSLIDLFLLTRKETENLCKPLATEDYVVQPIVDVSPPKWHLGHTTWFFEEFVLSNVKGYKVFDPNFSYVFNSYYETVGKRVVRTDRGNLSRPGVNEVYDYRAHVDAAMKQFLEQGVSQEVNELITLGINHEQQHQELLLTDIKYILGNNPLLPAYGDKQECLEHNTNDEYVEVKEGIKLIGHQNRGFCYDNELGVHKVFLADFAIRTSLVRNEEYIAFLEDGGYQNFELWHAEAWDWVKSNNVLAPLYWFKEEDGWWNYTLNGYQKVEGNASVTHISYYEAFAFAEWCGKRLPTEFEWEAASHLFDWGERWEWTESAYLPYPKFNKAPGAIGEYNGKFMVNQKVLRGASIATANNHSRCSYRNFFHPNLRWQYTGIRLAK